MQVLWPVKPKDWIKSADKVAVLGWNTHGRQQEVEDFIDMWYKVSTWAPYWEQVAFVDYDISNQKDVADYFKPKGYISIVLYRGAREVYRCETILSEDDLLKALNSNLIN